MNVILDLQLRGCGFDFWPYSCRITTFC